MISPKTASALAAFRKDAKPTIDAAAFAIVKADVLTFYGWAWPDNLDLIEGGKALFDFLIAKQERRHSGAKE